MNYKNDVANVAKKLLTKNSKLKYIEIKMGITGCPIIKAITIENLTSVSFK